MLGTSLDFPTLVIVIVGALLAGFTTGFAGFGTGLFASGIWFHALPAAMVLIGAWIGARVYFGVSAQTFQCVVLSLLLVSGCILIGQVIGVHLNAQQ